MQLVAAKHSKQKYNIHIHEEKYNKIKEFICWSESPLPSVQMNDSFFPRPRTCQKSVGFRINFFCIFR